MSRHWTLGVFDQMADRDRYWDRQYSGSDAAGDTVVFLDPDGVHYIACFEGGSWFRWPARSGGWSSRARVTESHAEGCEEVANSRLAMLALRLSGAIS